MFDCSNNEIENFFNDNMQEFARVLEPREDAKYYMDKLLDDGHGLYLISHKAYSHYTEPYKITENWLKDNNINYTKLILSKTTNKSKECKENKIADIIGVNVRTIKRNFKVLSDNNIIERVGSDKTGYWEVLK